MRRKIEIVLIALMLVLSLNVYHKNGVQAAPVPDASLEVKLRSDTSDLASNNKVYFNISLVNVVNIDTTKPFAMSANLSYTNTLLKNPSIKGVNGWSAIINGNKVLLDSSSFNAEQTIATLTFTVNTPITSTTKTKISLTDVEVDSNNEYNEVFAKIDSDEITLNATPGSGDSDDSGSSQGQGDDTTDDEQGEEQNDDDDGSRREELIYSQGGDNSNGDEEGSTQRVNSIEPVKDTTTSPTPIPQAGGTLAIYIFIGIIAVVGVYTFIRDKKFYD